MFMNCFSLTFFQLYLLALNFTKAYNRYAGNLVSVSQTSAHKLIDHYTDWCILLDPSNINFDINCRKLNYATEVKMNIEKLWPSFVAYVLQRRGELVTGEELITHEKDKQITLQNLLGKMFCNCKRVVRDNCQKKYGMHFSSRGNALGGKGNKIANKRTSEEINKWSKNERRLRKQFPSGTYYFYQRKNIPLTFTCAYKDLYVENEKTTVFKVAFSDEDWYNWEKNFDCHFWKFKKSSNIIDTGIPDLHYPVPSTVTFLGAQTNEQDNEMITEGENVLMNIDVSLLSSIDFS